MHEVVIVAAIYDTISTPSPVAHFFEQNTNFASEGGNSALLESTMKSF